MRLKVFFIMIGLVFSMACAYGSSLPDNKFKGDHELYSEADSEPVFEFHVPTQINSVKKEAFPTCPDASGYQWRSLPGSIQKHDKEASITIYLQGASAGGVGRSFGGSII